MRKLITVVLVAVLLASGAAPPVLAGAGHRHHGSGYGYSYDGYRYRHSGGHYYKHRPYYGHHGRHRRHRHGGHHYSHGDAAVVLGILAGAVVLGALLSRPAPAPARPPVLRSPMGAPLGGCLQTTGTGTWNGRPAQFSGTMCYDPAGRAYVIRGSQRFVGYLR